MEFSFEFIVAVVIATCIGSAYAFIYRAQDNKRSDDKTQQAKTKDE